MYLGVDRPMTRVYYKCQFQWVPGESLVQWSWNVNKWTTYSFKLLIFILEWEVDTCNVINYVQRNLQQDSLLNFSSVNIFQTQEISDSTLEPWGLGGEKEESGLSDHTSSLSSHQIHFCSSAITAPVWHLIQTELVDCGPGRDCVQPWPNVPKSFTCSIKQLGQY